MDYSGKKWLSGTDLAVNGAGDKTIIAAQGAGTRIRVMAGNLVVTTAAVGGGGVVKLEDGLNGTAIWQAPADSIGSYQIDFGPLGYPLSENTLLNLAVDSAATTQASARLTITAFA